MAIMAWAADPGDFTQAETLIRIGDARWLDREAARFATSVGQDPAVFRRYLAERLYRTHALDGLDLLRPAVLWWRAQGVLTGVIPLKDRRAFCQDFGVEQPPLVRVGEREGTVIYTQNCPEGLREYRVLVSEDVAAIGHSADEARRLLQRAPEWLATDPAQPAVRVVLRGPALAAALRVPATLPLLRLPGSGLDAGLAVQACLTWMARESTSLTCDVRQASAGMARVTVTLQARPDGDVGQWLAAQQNQATRLAAMIDGPTTAVVMTAHVNLHGRAESMGEGVLPAYRAAVGARWTAGVDESWRQLWRLAERLGDVGMALDVGQDGLWQWTTIGEQPRAADQITHLHAVAATATGVAGRSIEVDGLPTMTRTLGERSDATVAGQRHLVTVVAPAAQAAAAQQAALRLASTAAQVVPPRGQAAIAWVRADVARLVRLVPGVDRDADIAPAMVEAMVVTKPGGVLQLDMMVPLEPLAAALAKLPPTWW